MNSITTVLFFLTLTVSSTLGSENDCDVCVNIRLEAHEGLEDEYPRYVVQYIKQSTVILLY